MERRKVDILCVQETRWKGSKACSIGAGFKLFYYGVDSKRNGVGVVLKEEFVRNVLEVKRVSDRVMSLKLEIEGVMLNVVSGYAPQVGCELEEKEKFWSELDEVMESIPMGERVVIGADFNGHVGEGNTGDEEVMGKFGVKERNLEGQMVVDFAKRMDMAVVNTYFQKREGHRVTYKSGGRRTQKLRQALGGQVVLPDDWETIAEVIRETGRKVLGETWWWNEEVQDSIQRKRLAKKKWDMDRTEENRQEYKELQHRVKREVSKAKQKAYDELYTRDGQRELNCVFVDLEKAYDRVPREELWYCMRKSGVAEKYVRVVQDMYESSRTVVRCAVGQTEEFNVEVGLHQGSALSPFLFAIVMDQLSEEVRQESPWTMMFADDIVICSESREQVEENLERWRFALERRGMKVSRSKTEYMCVNEREGSGTVRLQGEEVKKVQEFKYLGSTVQNNGECGKEVKKRVQAGWNGWRKVSGVLCDRKISVRIKGKVYRTVVRPAMLYGLETVSLRKRQESELEVAELKMLRFSLGVRRLDRIRNEYIRGTAHVGRLGDKVREARLRWFGYVQRREKISTLYDHAALPVPTPGFNSHPRGSTRILKTGPTPPETIRISAPDPVSELVEALRHALISTPVAAPPAITSASTVTSPSPPVIASPMATPAPFSGSVEDCNGFLLQCLLALEMQPHLYPDNQAKVAFIISHLDGKALHWAEPIWTQNNPIVTSLPNFIKHFKEVFGKPAWDSSVGERLCRKQDVMSVSDYALQFRTLAAASGWNEQALITTYRQGLDPRVWLHLAAYEYFIRLEKFIQLSIRFATRM
ncbi:hypothetical protein QTP86_003947 [Hemibagrus guttatus]|nr:hypothetical protein QTP86_003947 [Hemibagrus guttatus]